jgi:hypothetical protein
MKISEAKSMVELSYSTRIPIILLSSLGIGKSSIIKQFTSEKNIGYVEIRASQQPIDEIGDIRGIGPDGKLLVLPQAWVPTEEAIRAGVYPKEGVVFCDELADSSLTHQAAYNQLVLDRRLGSAKLADGWHVVAASNRQSDKASAGRLSTALINRFMVVTVEADTDDFIHYAQGNGFDPDVPAFIRWQPEFLSNFESGKKDSPFASPRSWHRVSDLRKNDGYHKLSPGVQREAIKGLVGEAAMVHFMSFLEFVKKVPSLVDLRLNPDTYPLVREPVIKFALMGAILRNLTAESFQDYYQYMKRMEPELIVVFVKDALSRNKTIATTKAYSEFAGNYGRLLV